MKTTNKLFTIEFDYDHDIVEMHLNRYGIDDLIKILKKIKEENTQDHWHLMSTDWGGSELTNEKQNLDKKVHLINHLKIHYWE